MVEGKGRILCILKKIITINNLFDIGRDNAFTPHRLLLERKLGNWMKLEQGLGQDFSTTIFTLIM